MIDEVLEEKDQEIKEVKESNVFLDGVLIVLLIGILGIGIWAITSYERLKNHNITHVNYVEKTNYVNSYLTNVIFITKTNWILKPFEPTNSIPVIIKPSLYQNSDIKRGFGHGISPIIQTTNYIKPRFITNGEVDYFKNSLP